MSIEKQNRVSELTGDCLLTFNDLSEVTGILIAALLFNIIEVNIGGLRLLTTPTAQACFTTLPPGALWNVRRINTPDNSGTDASPSLAADGNGTVIAVWQGTSANAVDPRGDDPATGGALNGSSPGIQTIR